MKVLVIGSGGREHTLVWKLFQSEKVDKIYVAPGNDGMLELAERVDIAADDIDSLANWAKENKIDLTVVGPEISLVRGVVDEFEKRDLKIFGPDKIAAQIEGSKVFAKDLLRKYKIPTAEYEVFTEPQEALNYLEEAKYPLVVKAEGLAAGKGVIIATEKEVAKAAVEKIMAKRVFGDAGDRIVIEDFLDGEEVSVLAVTDGESIVPLCPAQDHKAVFDGDEGPNTGGMGAYSPTSFFTEEMMAQVEKNILKPTLKAFQTEGIKYKGVLYAGLILTDTGPKVLEFNARFGDPETQVIIPRLKTDLVDLMELVIEERLNEVKLEWDKRAALCVVLASGGYPIDYQKGYVINGLEDLNKYDNVFVFHAGTRKEGQDFVTDGGRVLGITVLAEDMFDAVNLVYECVETVDFEDMHYRSDIGCKVINKEDLKF